MSASAFKSPTGANAPRRAAYVPTRSAIRYH
uniref:Uncharacterized protein n=1 Tax=Leviviridae sp. TaxID=2027243 RepID=A0A514CZZ5_9VIRU|nr:MAG: hypothetical protein H2Rhizo32440e3526_000003 [Leviviridae sp.]